MAIEVRRNELMPAYEGLALIIEELKPSLIAVEIDGTINIFFKDKEAIRILPVAEKES